MVGGVEGVNSAHPINGLGLVLITASVNDTRLQK